MTKDEAVNVLKNTTLILGRVNGKMALAEALQMAITALEADNVVERIAYMSQLNGGANYFDAFMALSRQIKRNGENSEALQTDGDCISRQCALDDIETVDPSMLLDVNWVKNWVKALPSAQPERKTGKWIRHEPFDGEHKNCNKCIECSNCGTWFGADCYAETSYCPSCGADMREGQDETD